MALAGKAPRTSRAMLLLTLLRCGVAARGEGSCPLSSAGGAACPARLAHQAPVLLQTQHHSSNAAAAAVPLAVDDGGACCFSAQDASDICGTCYPYSWATPGSWCASSVDNCQSCAGGRAVWCAGGGHPTTTEEPVSQPAQAEQSGGAACCLSAAEADDACGTCYHGAWAAPGSWCAGSAEKCQRCSRGRAVWCASGTPQPPGAPARTSAPTPAATPAPTPRPTLATAPLTTPAPEVDAPTPALAAGPTPAPTLAPPPTPAATPGPTPAPTPAPALDSSWVTGTYTTGYWDCCKPSCSWPNKGNVNSPVLSCDAGTGSVLSDASVASVCLGGTAASCTNNKPFVVTSSLSMGFAAAAVSGSHGLTGDANCGQCFELRFTDQIHSDGNWGGSHPRLAGKTMIVQVTNIGYDVNGEHSFDLQIPGAGQGIFTSGCPAQFSGYSGGDFDCDNNYGGCEDKSGCARLPAELQAGCHWRYDWYAWKESGGQTNNPYVNFRRVRCPALLTEISGSVPEDDDAYPAIDVSAYP